MWEGSSELKFHQLKNMSQLAFCIVQLETRRVFWALHNSYHHTGSRPILPSWAGENAYISSKGVAYQLSTHKG